MDIEVIATPQPQQQQPQQRRRCEWPRVWSRGRVLSLAEQFELAWKQRKFQTRLKLRAARPCPVR